MNIKKLFKRASQTQEGWLTPTVYKGGGEQVEVPSDELENILLHITHGIEDTIAEQEKLRRQADDAGKFGEYRYRDGMIAGLKEAKEIVGDFLRDQWGM